MNIVVFARVMMLSIVYRVVLNACPAASFLSAKRAGLARSGQRTVRYRTRPTYCYNDFSAACRNARKHLR